MHIDLKYVTAIASEKERRAMKILVRENKSERKRERERERGRERARERKRVRE